MKRKIKNWLAVFLALIMGLGTLTAQETLLGENFSSSTYPPDGWTRYTGTLDGSLSSSTSTWTRRTTTPISGGYSVAFNMYNTRNYWLVTPSITLPANSTLELDVAATNFNSAAPATSMGSNEIFYIVVSTDGGETWTTENVVAQYDYETSPSLSDFTTPTHLTVSLANYTGDVKIGFYGHKPSTGGDWDIHIGNILVSAPVSCYRPTVLTVEDITSSAAAVSWTMNESNPNASINLQYTLATDTEWENPIATITNATNPYSLTELIANTQYKVRVQSVCGDSEVSAWKEGTFKTACGATPIPYTMTFDEVATNAMPDCWDQLQVYNTYPNVTTTNARSGRALEFRADENGSFAVLPVFADLNTLRLSLWTRREGSSSGTLYVGYMTDPGDVSTFTSLFSVSSSEIGDENYHKYDVSYSSADPNARMAIQYNTTGAYSSWYWFVDDITVDLLPSCVEPTTVTVSDVTSSTATVNWVNDEANADVPANVQYTLATDNDWADAITLSNVSGTNVSIEDLAANTQYKVRVQTICGPENLSAWRESTIFKTLCSPISVTETPYTTSFEDDATGSGTVPACWTRPGTSSYPYVYTSSYSNYARTGSKTLYWSYNTNPIALPAFVEDVKDLQLLFFARGGAYSGGGSMEVGVMTDPTDASTFVPVATITTAYSSYPEEANVVRFKSYAGEGQYIAMRPATSSSYYVDDVTVELAPTCLEPENIVASSITTTSATVSWTGDAESYQLRYTVTGEDNYTSTTVSGNTYTIPSLDANTNYTVEIKSICGSDLSDAANTTFKTACGTISVLGEAYTMNFDDVATNSMPDCWNKIIGYGSYPYVVSGNAVSGNSLQFNSYTYQYAYVILPAFAESLSDLQMVFSAKAENASSSGNLVVGLMTDPSDASTFETVETITASNTSYQEYTINFSYEGIDKYIAIRQEPNTNNYYWWIDDLTVREKPSCLEPTTVAVSGVTSSTAVVTWVNDQANTEIPANVQYTLATDNDWADAITLSNVSGTNVSIEDLAANTQYKVRVQTICGPENLSAWRESTIFKTLCSPISVAETPYTTSFEDDATGSGTVPACWTRPGTSSYPYVYAYNYYAKTGSNSLYFYGYSSTDPIVLPAFVEDVKDLQLLFFARGGAYSGGGSMEVGVMTDPTDASTFVPVATITTAYSSYPEEANVVRFKSYAGEGQYIAMRPATTSSYYVDDVTVEIAPTCFEPENVVASNITTSSATITWEDESKSTAWTLEYKKANETEYTAVSGLTEKFYSLTELDINTIYDVRITGSCVGGENVSNVMTFSTSALNVTAIPFTENFEESNSYVQLSGTGTNQWFVGNATATVDGENSLYVSNDGGENNAYTHSESNAYAVMNIEFGDAPEYFLSFDWKSRGESSNWDRLMVFLMNEDEDLSSLSRSYTTGRIFNQTAFDTDPTWQNAIITLNDVQNTTKKLVFYWYNDDTRGDNPPAAIDNIMIAECVAPTNVVVSNITEDAADLVWADNGGSSVWNVEYKKADATTWTSIEATTKAYSFTELRPNTTYDVRISGNCNETKYSEVSQFTTLCLETSSEREATICDNETYTDADFTLTAENEGLNYVTLGNQYGCDSTITLTLTVNPTYAPVFDVEICEGESYTENNFNVENPEPGVYQYTQELQTVNGCDSIVTLTLTVNPLLEASISPVICYGETFTYNGKDYTATGVYLDTVASSVTCDTAYTINLTVIRNQEERPVEICAGQTYQFKDEEWTIAGTYVRTLEGVNGDCDTTATYILTVNPLKDSTINKIITYGTSYTENGFNENETGTYTLTTPSLLTGCDSTVTLNLTVMTAIETPREATICANESYTDEDFVEPLTLAGVYRDTLVSERYGIDSIIVLTLNVNPVYNIEPYEAEICAGEEYTDENFVEPLTEAGTYYHTYQSVLGCDSVVAVNLIVYPTYNIVIDTAICQGQVYDDGGFRASATATYYQKLQTDDGCDSIVTLHLTVNPVKTTNLEATICSGTYYTENNFNLTAYTEEVEKDTVVVDTLDTYLGCDSIVTLTLTVNPVKATELEATICQGQTYTENNFDVAGEEAGVFTYTQNLETSLGCDSTVTLTLTVNPIYNPVFDVVICEGESYTENNFNENATGTYTQNLQTENGCDSIVTLNLTVNPVKTTNLEATICSGTYYTENNFNLTAYTEEVEKDTVVVDTLDTYLGCDSTVTLTLHVRPQYEEVITAEICKGETYTDYDFNAKRSGQYIQYRTTVDGCDSNLVLNLTVNPIYTKDVTEYICKGTTFEFGGENLTDEGQYTHTFSTVKGCDSVVNLTLMYYPYYETTPLTVEICDGQSYDFHGESFTQAGTYERTLQTINGCDSVVALTIVVNPVKTTPLTATICSNESYDFFGTTLRYAGTYNHTLQTTKGCDSVISLTLIVNPVKTTNLEATICSGTYYTENNFNLTAYTEEVEKDTVVVDTLDTYLGCDSIVNLTLHVLPIPYSNNTQEICQGQTFDFNGEILFKSGDYTSVLAGMGTNGCDSIAYLTLIVNPVYSENRVVNICPGTAYDFYGQRISVAGNYEKHFETVNGCDSVVYLQVIVNPVYEGIVKDVTICEGEEYVFAGETLTEAGSYTRTLQTINGCDSTVTLNLSVTPLNNQVFDVAICEGQTYTENGFNASETGTYTREVVENNCTSTWTLNLTVNPVYDTVIEATICEGATYTENGFSADLVGTYYRTLQTVNGCDSLVTLHLQMTDMLETAIEATICSSDVYPFNGEDLNVAGTYTANLTGVGGCDSVVTLTLHVNDVLTSEFDAAICEGQVYDWNGVACTENTDYTQTFTSVSGCDSVVTLHLTVYPVENTVEEATICEGASYTWNNVEYTEAGTYELTLQNANGCDYTATLTLNVTPNIQNEETISFCEGSSVMYKGVEYDQAGTYILTSVNPETQCTETTVLTVTSLPVEDQLTEATICEGTSYTWNGTTYTEAGTYPVTLQNENGCNYTSTLALTVNPIAHETIDQTICQGSAVQFGNLVLSSTGSYTQTFQSVVTGCDSVVTLNLTVSPNKTTTTNVTICEGETYEFNGEVLAQAGLYSATLPSYEGCDSTVTLNLIVNAVKTSTINATICEGETYEFNNQTLSEAGQYTAELQAVSGCDSIVTLNLTVNPLNNQTFNATICEGEVYNQNGFVVSQAGTYTREVVANGCTSIWTLNLTVTPANNQTISATICQGEIYTENGFIANQSGTYTRQVVENGCTSIWTLNLTVLPVYAQTISATICEGESYEFNGQSYTEAGTYTASLQTINGCDSTVTLNLSVTPLNNQTFNATICEGEIYNQNGFMANQTGTYTREVVANGCTSTWTLNLTVTPTNNQTFNATICQGEIYNENGFMANQSGTYTREVVENGCTSIWTLNLTVNPVYSQTINATICEGESYDFNNQTYTQTGQYVAELQSITGCDSIVTLNLSVTPLNNQTFNATICEGEIYNENGFMANQSGTYTREVVANGCTSIWTLNLTVNPLQTETINETVCYGETFTYNGQTYSQTGTYTTVVEGEEGACDTEVTINLVIRDANPDIDELVVLDNSELPYTFMGNEYNDYGTYVVTIQDENGCEQVYNLTIQHNSGLNAVESIYNVTLYPNPTMDNATLKVEGLNEEATVVVTDQTGRMISSEKLALGQTEMTINSASLAEGVYYIRIITKNSTRTEKLIRR